MTPRHLALALVLVVPLVAGCNPAAKLHGTWDLEVEKPDPAANALGTRVPSAILSFMQLKRNIEFQDDGDCIVELKASGQTEKAKGKWKWAKSEGDVLVLKVKLGEAAEQEVRITFLEPDRIETVPFPVGEESWTDETATFTRR